MLQKKNIHSALLSAVLCIGAFFTTLQSNAQIVVTLAGYYAQRGLLRTVKSGTPEETTRAILDVLGVEA